MKRYFGEYGGQYASELFIPFLNRLKESYSTFRKDKEIQKRYRELLQRYCGRPSPLFFAKNLSEFVGAKVYLKREDLNHTGSHKINNALGQALLAQYMGCDEIIAETGAGQHGVATATAAAMLGIKCRIFMGAVDVERQKFNVFRMRLLGAEVVPVNKGQATLKDAINEAFRYWAANIERSYYLIGSVVGPFPYPVIVRDFQRVIGNETYTQIMKSEGRLPDRIVACVGGGSNAIGIFYRFIRYKEVKLIGVEGGGTGRNVGEHSRTLSFGEPGILHGMYTKLLMQEDGNIAPVHSIAAGLDYPGVGPELAYYAKQGRIEISYAEDSEALEAFETLTKLEGITPAFESAHAVSYVLKNRKKLKDNLIVINVSGRGDKDLMDLFLKGDKI